MKLWIITPFLVWLLFLGSIFFDNQSVNDCVVQLLSNQSLPLDTQQLIYMRDTDDLSVNMLTSTNTSFQEPRLNAINRSVVSPNRQWLASLELNSEQVVTLVIRNQEGIETFRQELDNQRISHIYWIGNEQILTIVTSPSNGLLVYSIINPFTPEVQTIYPANLDDGAYPENIALGVFSPNGLLVISSGINQRIYDVETGEQLELQNVMGTVWTYDSDGLLYLDPMTNAQQPGEGVEIYEYVIDEEQNRLTLVYDNIPNTIIGLVPNSLSPNEAYILLERASVTEDRSDTLQIGSVIIDIAEAEVLTTCFEHASNYSPFQLSWSSESRYLALYGVLNGEGNGGSGNVYIYDTQTDDIYLVYQGRADIIGWMASPESTEN